MTIFRKIVVALVLAPSTANSTPDLLSKEDGVKGGSKDRPSMGLSPFWSSLPFEVLGNNANELGKVVTTIEPVGTKKGFV